MHLLCSSVLMSMCEILATIYLSHFSGQHLQWATMRYEAQSPSTENKQAYLQVVNSLSSDVTQTHCMCRIDLGLMPLPGDF